ncbi:MICOS complex subunit MIC25 isoform X2 [Opisthocomus hoazin]|uniref:MICOS complex subunit MIC25 isoform X2 n=1 Tax=Opisthocomus hoazin TaxID=30419 RepID=UPI003F52F6D1
MLAGGGRREALLAAAAWCERGGTAGRGVPGARPAGMGGNESSQGGRKVSFGLDERERVRVLQGIRLSEDVVNRMKESPQRDKQRLPRSSSATAPSSPAAEGKPKSSTGIQPPMASDSVQKSTAAEQELYRRYEQEQALVQEELLRLAKREREAASEALSTALQRERNNTNEERQRVAQLAVELQGREAELKRREAFYKEQLARIERKNAEIYKLTSEQYQEAATKAEEWINTGRVHGSRKKGTTAGVFFVQGRKRRRNTDPVCASLQSEILKCYQENKREVLKCSELAKEYQRCVSAAQKINLCVSYLEDDAPSCPQPGVCPPYLSSELLVNSA